MMRGTTPPHGTNSRYSNQGCHCDECRRAHADYQKSWYAKHPGYHQLQKVRTRRKREQQQQLQLQQLQLQQQLAG